MRKVVVFMMVLVVSLFVAQKSRAQMMGQGMMVGSDLVEEESYEHERLDTVMTEVLGKHGVSEVSELDCDSLSEEELERIGDAWMETQHPGEAHERMDAMMGGEGSESLAAMHIQMGEGYLGCSNKRGWGNMMGPGMMGGWGGGGMMGNWGAGFGVWSLASLVVYVLFAALLVAAIRYLWLKGNEVKQDKGK